MFGLFGLRLYIEIDYCVPDKWMAAEFLPLSWSALKQVWREFWAAWKGEGYFCDAFILLLREQPDDYVLIANN